jgi:hypothetical protein
VPRVGTVFYGGKGGYILGMSGGEVVRVTRGGAVDGYAVGTRNGLRNDNYVEPFGY